MVLHMIFMAIMTRNLYHKTRQEIYDNMNFWDFLAITTVALCSWFTIVTVVPYFKNGGRIISDNDNDDLEDLK